MDLLDLLANRMDVDSELKHPIHALVCFSETATGKKLGVIAAQFAVSRKEKSSITFLQLQKPLDVAEQDIFSTEDDKKAEMVMDSDVYQNRSFTSITEKVEKNRIVVRTFVKHSKDWVSDILKTSNEQGCNLVLLGIESMQFSIDLWQKYYRLKSNPAQPDNHEFSKSHPVEAGIINDVLSITDRNPMATGLFINRNLKKICKIFIPVLSATDIQVFPYALFRFTDKEGIELMVWDAIGIVKSDPQVYKFYQSILKKNDGKMMMWDDNQKIERDFIQSQDLVIIGVDGWGKLLSTPLPWIDALPSVIIIKDNTL